MVVPKLNIHLLEFIVLRKGNNHPPSNPQKLQLQNKRVVSSQRLLLWAPPLGPEWEGQGQRNPQSLNQQGCNMRLICEGAGDSLMENATINGHVCLNLGPRTEM